MTEAALALYVCLIHALALLNALILSDCTIWQTSRCERFLDRPSLPLQQQSATQNIAGTTRTCSTTAAVSWAYLEFQATCVLCLQRRFARSRSRRTVRIPRRARDWCVDNFNGRN